MRRVIDGLAILTAGTGLGADTEVCRAKGMGRRGRNKI